MSVKAADFSSLGVTGDARPMRKAMRAHQPQISVSLESRLRSLWNSAPIQLAVASLAVLLITEFFRRGPSVNATTVGFAFLLAILAASTSFDLRTLIVMCFEAGLAYDFYFLPPVGTLNINDPQDWVALFAFLITALVGSQLASRARRRTDEATLRRLEAEKLYRLSERLLSTGEPMDLLAAIPKHIVTSFGMAAAALYISEGQKIFDSGNEFLPLDIPNLQTVAAQGRLRTDSNRNICFVPVSLGKLISGSIAMSGRIPSIEILEAIAALVAVAVGRARAIEQVAKIEATRESERLKSVLLDAITHDFRTPLTSIKISVTGLLEDLEFDRGQQKELLVIIDEECDRINELVGEASEMARLESGEVKLDWGAYSLGELISSALADCSDIARSRNLCIDLEDSDSLLSVDLALAKKVLLHLIANANLYSSPGQPITVSAEEHAGFQFISVRDKGPGIEENELGHIFEKFYRGKRQRHRVHGTGMGLPIAKAIVEAHGGSMSVSSREGQSSVFTFSLPILQQETASRLTL